MLSAFERITNISPVQIRIINKQKHYRVRIGIQIKRITELYANGKIGCSPQCRTQCSQNQVNCFKTICCDYFLVKLILPLCCKIVRKCCDICCVAFYEFNLIMVGR